MLNVIGAIMIVSGLIFFLLIVPKKRGGKGDAKKPVPIPINLDNGDDEDDLFSDDQ